MRAREITEIVKIPRGEFTPSKSNMEKYNPALDKISKPLPGGSGLKYVVKRDGGTLSIYILDPGAFSGGGDLVGQITLGRFHQFPIKNAWQVDSTVVDPDYRSQGIGKSMYGVILSILKLTLIAGGDQTEGGQRSWLSLANIPGVEVRGYVPVSDQYFSDNDSSNLQKKKFNQLIDNIMNMGGEYIGRSKNAHYFSFDVVPGTGELEPAVKKELKLYGYNDLTNPGLYATWSGN
jgi:GNAT superfamily N-acetyltransferase